MAPHRYWRIKVDTIGNMSRACVAVAELLFFASDADALVLNRIPMTGGTAFQFSFYDTGYEGSKAFDSTSSSIWHSNCAAVASQYVGYDFGAGNEKEIVSAALLSRNGFGAQDTPITGKLQYSDDGSAWSDLYSFITHEWPDTQSAQYLLPLEPSYADVGGHRYWRAKVTTPSNLSGFSSVSMVNFVRQNKIVGVFGTPSHFIPGDTTVTGSSASVVNSADKIAGHIQYVTAATQWIALDFGVGQSILIDRIYIGASRDDPIRSWFAADMEYSDDGSNWTATGSKTFDLPWASNPIQYIENDNSGPPPSSARKRRSVIVIS